MPQRGCEAKGQWKDCGQSGHSGHSSQSLKSLHHRHFTSGQWTAQTTRNALCFDCSAALKAFAQRRRRRLPPWTLWTPLVALSVSMDAVEDSAVQRNRADAESGQEGADSDRPQRPQPVDGGHHQQQSLEERAGERMRNTVGCHYMCGCTELRAEGVSDSCESCRGMSLVALWALRTFCCLVSISKLAWRVFLGRAKRSIPCLAVPLH